MMNCEKCQDTGEVWDALQRHYYLCDECDRDTLLARIADLEAENARLQELLLSNCPSCGGGNRNYVCLSCFSEWNPASAINTEQGDD